MHVMEYFRFDSCSSNCKTTGVPSSPVSAELMLDICPTGVWLICKTLSPTVTSALISLPCTSVNLAFCTVNGNTVDERDNNNPTPTSNNRATTHTHTHIHKSTHTHTNASVTRQLNRRSALEKSSTAACVKGVILRLAFRPRGDKGVCPNTAARHPKSAAVHTDICLGHSQSTVCVERQ